MPRDVQDWDTNPDNNTLVDGISIAEGNPARNTNNAMRAIMSGVRRFWDTITNRRIDAGTSLTGGGNLSANRTISVADRGIGTDQIANDAVTQDKLEQPPANWALATDNTPIPSSKLVNTPGLDRTEVDARVRALVDNWAETGNRTRIPATKLVEILGSVENWAEVGNNSTIPSSKLVNAPARGGSTSFRNLRFYNRFVNTSNRAIIGEELGNDDWDFQFVNFSSLDISLLTQHLIIDQAFRIANSTHSTNFFVFSSHAAVNSSGTIELRGRPYETVRGNGIRSIPNSSIVDLFLIGEAHVTADWAQRQNTDRIPSSKLPTIPGSNLPSTFGAVGTYVFAAIKMSTRNTNILTGTTAPGADIVPVRILARVSVNNNQQVLGSAVETDVGPSGGSVPIVNLAGSWRLMGRSLEVVDTFGNSGNATGGIFLRVS